MTMPTKRTLLRALPASLLIAAAFGSGAAHAQSNWPTKPVRIIVGFAPGGTTDVLARLLAPKLSEQLGQPVVVENRAGAGSNLGASMAARAPADGYTIFASSVSNAINMALYAKPGYDFVKDFTHVALVAKVPNLLVVNPKVPVKNAKEYLEYAKANPGKLTFASAGSGSSIHLSGELFSQMAHVEMTHVPYRGSGPAVTDLLGGQVNSMFDNMPSAIPHVKAGKLRALAVTSAKRSPALPDVPTIAESVLPGYDVQSWFGIELPAGAPADITKRLAAEVSKALALPDVKAKLVDLGAEAGTLSPADYAAFVAGEVAKWGPVVKKSGATVD